jgi:hypothetical protein
LVSNEEKSFSTLTPVLLAIDNTGRTGSRLRASGTRLGSCWPHSRAGGQGCGS